MYERGDFISAVAEATKLHLDRATETMTPEAAAIYKSGVRGGIGTILDLTYSGSREEGYRIYKVEVQPVGSPIQMFDAPRSIDRLGEPYHPLIKEIWDEVNT